MRSEKVEKNSKKEKKKTSSRVYTSKILVADYTMGIITFLTFP